MRIVLSCVLLLSLAACAVPASGAPLPAGSQPTLAAAATPVETLPAAPLPTLPGATQLPSPGPTETPLPPSETPYPTLTPGYPETGFGPQDFPPDVNPLTGLGVSNPALLNRRPMVIKVSNLPRSVRPQWGLSLADTVYEYYTEEGGTRFAAVYLGSDASRVGPIRSARFFDSHLTQMYDAILAFVSADQRVLDRLFNSSYAERLVSEYPARCPPMCRYELDGVSHVVTNTTDLSAHVTRLGVPNGRQSLEGLLFQQQLPPGGQPAAQLFTHYSLAIYNRWDYDAASARYVRYVDEKNAEGGTEFFVAHTDRLTGQAITADNVVVLMLEHYFFSRNPEMVDIVPSSPSDAYVFRDGMMYKVRWKHKTLDSLITLVGTDGKPFPLKPGVTWYQVVGIKSQVRQVENGWRFTFQMP